MFIPAVGAVARLSALLVRRVRLQHGVFFAPSPSPHPKPPAPGPPRPPSPSPKCWLKKNNYVHSKATTPAMVSRLFSLDSGTKVGLGPPESLSHGR
jgi:hypothetical protein